jgi:hypothetical protein
MLRAGSRIPPLSPRLDVFPRQRVREKCVAASQEFQQALLTEKPGGSLCRVSFARFFFQP